MAEVEPGFFVVVIAPVAEGVAFDEVIVVFQRVVTPGVVGVVVSRCGSIVYMSHNVALRVAKVGIGLTILWPCADELAVGVVVEVNRAAGCAVALADELITRVGKVSGHSVDRFADSLAGGIVFIGRHKVGSCDAHKLAASVPGVGVGAVEQGVAHVVAGCRRGSEFAFDNAVINGITA